MKHYLFRVVFGLASLTALSACTKYLSKVSDESLIIPTTADDFRQLLDNNLMTNNSTPGLGHLGTDDYFISLKTWQSEPAPAGTAYNWQPDIFQGMPSLSWNNPYNAIYYCNVVIDGIGAVDTSAGNGDVYKAVLGGAYFERAFHYQNLEETFGEPYRPATASSDMGVLLRLTQDPTAKVGRSSVAAVYNQILADARRSVSLLPSAVQMANRNRPSQPAAYALLARICLTMQDYVGAQHYADSCLALYDKLVDYDTVNSTLSRPFAFAGNDEVLFQCSAYNIQLQYSTSAEVDTLLYRSYDPNDLRKTVFFHPAPSGDGGVCFKGQYTGQVYLFSGMANDEVYLTRAECRARNGDVTGALNDLNTLLSHRWRAGSFQPYSGATADQALALVLAERRKETLFRETRWFDLRRLNQESRWSTTLVRILDSNYVLPPGSPRYAYPLPGE